jgi:hypothetical protein
MVQSLCSCFNFTIVSLFDDEHFQMNQMHSLPFHQDAQMDCTHQDLMALDSFSRVQFYTI